MHTPKEITEILNTSLNAAWNNYIGGLTSLNLPPEFVECIKLTYFDAYKKGAECVAIYFLSLNLKTNLPKEKTGNASMDINNILNTLPEKERFNKN